MIDIISPQFYVVLDNSFETVDSLNKNKKEPARWKCLATHKREHHLNNKKETVNGTNIRTDSEIESSNLFEFPKENNLNRTDTTSLATNAPPTSLESTINNNNDNPNIIIIAENIDTSLSSSYDLFQTSDST